MTQRHDVERNRTGHATGSLFWMTVVGALAFGGCSGPKEEAPYPNRSIELIVPFSAGGGTDVFARVMKKAIDDNDLLPHPLNIRNVEGAGATIGSSRAKSARPDGYTMLVLHDAILTAQASGYVDYGPESFEAIAGTGEVGLVVAVWEDSPFQSLKELMEATRTRPDEIIFGANMGAITHYAGLQLESESKNSRFRYVQVGGGAHRFSQLKGKHIHVTGFSIEEFMRFRTDAKKGIDGVRGLAYFGPKRHLAALDVPTAGEQGYDISNSNVFYWWFPKGTDSKKVEMMADVLEKAMQTKEVKDFMANTHCKEIFLRGEGLQRRIEFAGRQYEHVSPRTGLRLPNFPLIVFLAALGLAAFVVFRGWQSGAGLMADDASQAKAAGFTPRPALAAVCVALTIAYALMLTLAGTIAQALGIPSTWIGFLPATILFVTALGMTLTDMRWKLLPFIVAIALVLSFGLHFVFEVYFHVDLP